MNEDGYEKGHHSLIAAPGKLARTCVVCGTRTRYFCYGCSADAPTIVHCCSPSRDGGRDCFANLHRVRKPNYQGDTRIFHRRRRVSDAKDAERGKQRRQRSLNHANLEAQRKVVNSTPTTRHKSVMLLYYTSNFNVCWIES